MACPPSRAKSAVSHPHKALGCCLFLWVGILLPTFGQQPSSLAGEEIFSANSHSGQFLVQANRLQLGSPVAARFGTNATHIRLDPMLVPVSCERIKQVVWRELGTTAQWQGRISVYIRPAVSQDEGVFVESQSFRDGWRYRLLLPEVLPRIRYVRAVVQVLLLELANRVPGQKGAEIPLWLIEGLTQQVLSSSEISVILSPPTPQSNRIGINPVVLEQRRLLPLEQAHRLLSDGKAMTFEELSWPVDSAMDTDDRFRLNAQVFINSLVSLPSGRASLLRFVELLPRYHNWQFAFLQAFAPAFTRPLDVEKWWALEVEQFLSRDVAQTWGEAKTWQKLEDALRSQVAIYAKTNELPKESEVPLSTILADWEPSQQVPVLRRKLVTLSHVRVRSSPSVVAVVDEYQAILRDYLPYADIGNKEWTKRRKSAQREASQVACNRLADLERRIKAARPVPNPALGAELEALRVGKSEIKYRDQ